jgi:hypothetical protein
MFDDDKGKKAATQKTKKNVEGEQPTKTEVLADDMHAV